MRLVAILTDTDGGRRQIAASTAKTFWQDLLGNLPKQLFPVGIHLDELVLLLKSNLLLLPADMARSGERKLEHSSMLGGHALLHPLKPPSCPLSPLLLLLLLLALLLLVPFAPVLQGLLALGRRVQLSSRL